MDVHIETRMVDANGLTFEVDQAGTGPQFALLLHGFPESKFSWRYQIPLLVKLGYRVWAPNLRGYGKSSKPKGVKAYLIDRLVDDVVGLVQAAGAKETLLMTHDWGSIIGWQVAMRKAIPLERLVIMNVPHPACFLREIQTWDQFKRSWYMLAFQLPFVPEWRLTADGASIITRAVCPGMAPHGRWSLHHHPIVFVHGRRSQSFSAGSHGRISPSRIGTGRSRRNGQLLSGDVTRQTIRFESQTRHGGRSDADDLGHERQGLEQCQCSRDRAVRA